MAGLPQLAIITIRPHSEFPDSISIQQLKLKIYKKHLSIKNRFRSQQGRVTERLM